MGDVEAEATLRNSVSDVKAHKLAEIIVCRYQKRTTRHFGQTLLHYKGRSTA